MLESPNLGELSSQQQQEDFFLAFVCGTSRYNTKVCIDWGNPINSKKLQVDVP